MGVSEYPPNTGCEISPKCIDCPIPYCIKEPNGMKRNVKELSDRGLTTSEIAKILHKNIRTIQRLTKMLREEGS